MKKTLMIVGMLSMAFSYGQEGRVGINTENPNATLEVSGVPTNTSVLDGIIAPKITGDQLKAKTYTTDQTGALVYVTEGASTANQVGQTVNVSGAGYYYFDGSVWQTFKGGSSVVSGGENIYTADGTLTGNRTVQMDNKNLNFADGNIGVNQTNPTAKLDIVSSTIGGGFKLVDGSQESGKVLTSDANGNANWAWPAVPMDVIDIQGLDNKEIAAGEKRLVYTGLALLVQPGKYMFNISLGVQHDVARTYTQGGTFLRLRFLSEEQASRGVFINDTTIMHPMAFASKYASLGIGFNESQGVLNGSLGINNTTNAPIIVHLYADVASSNNSYGGPAVNSRKINLLFKWNESTMTSMEVR